MSNTVILLSTTGTLQNVILNDLGARTFSHPTVDYNIASEFSLDELSSSQDLNDALINGHITLKDANGNPISDVNTVRSLITVSDNDNVPGYLKDKIKGFLNTITVNEINDGLDEYLEVNKGTNLFDKTVDTTADIIEATDKRFVTDADLSKLNDLVIPTNVVYVYSETDLPTPSSGKHTLAPFTKYVIRNGLTLSNSLELGESTVIEGESVLESFIIYTGTVDLFIINDVNAEIRELSIFVNNTTSNIFNSSNVNRDKILLLRFLKISGGILGTIEGFDKILLQDIIVDNTSNGITLINTNNIYSDNLIFRITNNGTYISITPNSIINSITFINLHLDVADGATGIYIDEANVNINEGIIFLSTVINKINTGIGYTGFNVQNETFESNGSSGNAALPNKITIPVVSSSELFNISFPKIGQNVYLSDYNMEALWDGTKWVASDGTEILRTLLIDDFESGSFSTNGWVVVNGGENDWYVGTATVNKGTYSAYISNDNGASNAYSSVGNSLDVSHIYIDINVPIASTKIQFEFDWKCEGEIGYDYMKVFDVSTAVTPTANAELNYSDAIGLSQYNNSTLWQHEVIQLPLSEGGTVRRFVFSWRNDKTVENQPPVAIDNVKITYV